MIKRKLVIILILNMAVIMIAGAFFFNAMFKIIVDF